MLRRLGKHRSVTESADPLAGRYRLLEECGAGGMSVVWHGFDEVLQRDVAVKLLKPEFAQDGELRTAIHREARAAAKLSHPSIASVYDFGETTQGLAFVVMELVSGAPFAARLHDGAVPWPEAVSVCGRVAVAMAEAHAQGVVHRDIKPGNVMVAEDGVKVVDFGISAVIGEADGGQLLGTPAYMAPERITGGRVDCATDVYALGLMLYRALAGELPWPAATASQVLLAHATGAAANLRRPPDVPDEIMNACQACLAKDPADRPTMADLAQILSPAAPLERPAVAPVLTPTAEFTLPMTVPVAPPVRRRHLVFAGVAAALLLIGMTASMTRLSGSPVPAPGVSFGEAVIPDAPAEQSLVPVRADDNSGPGNAEDAGDNEGQGSGNGHGNANGHDNGKSGSGGGNGRRG
jgi:serine/threonine-protein kinase